MAMVVATGACGREIVVFIHPVEKASCSWAECKEKEKKPKNNNNPPRSCGVWHEVEVWFHGICRKHEHCACCVCAAKATEFCVQKSNKQHKQCKQCQASQSVGLTDLVANGEWPLMACCWSKRRTFTMVHGTMSTGAVWCVLV